MSAWLLRAIVVGVVLALAAELGERALVRLGHARRWAWVAALAGSALLPLLTLLLPPLPGSSRLSAAEVARLLASQAPQGAPGAALPAGEAWSWLLPALWALASAALLALLAYAALRLGRARRGWAPAQVDGTDVLLSAESGPAVVGLLRPAVVLPAWVTLAPAEERRMVLAHEQEHVRAGDPWLLAAASLLTALLPWNPAVWWAQRRLRLALESDCDARVLASGVDRVCYGTFLLSTAARRRASWQLAAALVESRTTLERRIHAMTRKLPQNRGWAVLPLAAAVVLAVVACELGRPGGSGPASPVEPRADAADSLRGFAQGYRTVYDEGKVEGVATRMFTDTVFTRLRGEARDGQIRSVKVHRLNATEADVTTTDAQGHTETHRVHIYERTAVAPTGEARENALRHVLSVGGGSAVRERQPGRDTSGITSNVIAHVQPLIVIDGVLSTNEQMRALDTGRIRSVNVLKGEAALRAYGDRGANGVIQVTTK